MKKLFLFLSLALVASCQTETGAPSQVGNSTSSVIRVKHYEVVASTNLNEFNQHVNSLIEMGFLPIGGVSTVTFAGGTNVQYSQALLSNKKQ